MLGSLCVVPPPLALGSSDKSILSLSAPRSPLLISSEGVFESSPGDEEATWPCSGLSSKTFEPLFPRLRLGSPVLPPEERLLSQLSVEPEESRFPAVLLEAVLVPREELLPEFSPF